MVIIAAYLLLIPARPAGAFVLIPAAMAVTMRAVPGTMVPAEIIVTINVAPPAAERQEPLPPAMVRAELVMEDLLAEMN
jgi:hypothetical protein